MNTDTYNSISTAFEELYSRLRKQEGRIYSDEELLALPEVPATHRHYKEWKIRKDSCLRLNTYLRKKNTSLKILEPGCGNGWLSHQLAKIAGSYVTGVDINAAEIGQAKRTFRQQGNLEFIYGDVHAPQIRNASYDCIILASSIQYFASLPQLINELFPLLAHDGEIHILDSPLYKPGEVKAAQERTAAHFNQSGFPAMIPYYFHHTEEALSIFHYRVLYRPAVFHSFFSPHKNPFPWICLTKS